MTPTTLTDETVRSHMSAAIHALTRAGMTSHAESLDRARTAVAGIIAERDALRLAISEWWDTPANHLTPAQENAVDRQMAHLEERVTEILLPTPALRNKHEN